MKTSVPRIETARLILRAHCAGDLARCVAMWSDPDVVRYTIGVPSTEQATWRRLLAYLGHWELVGYGYWAVEERASGEYIGELGFADFKRDMEPSIRGIPELGWALAPHVHGRGYATEALRAVVAWADAHLREDRTVCIVNPKNEPSLRVAAKLGFRELQRTTMNGEPEILFARDRGDPHPGDR